MKDQSKFSLDALIRRIEKEGNIIVSVVPTNSNSGRVTEALIIYNKKQEK